MAPRYGRAVRNTLCPDRQGPVFPGKADGHNFSFYQIQENPESCQINGPGQLQGDSDQPWTPVETYFSGGKRGTLQLPRTLKSYNGHDSFRQPLYNPACSHPDNPQTSSQLSSAPQGQYLSAPSQLVNINKQGCSQALGIRLGQFLPVYGLWAAAQPI